MQSYLLQTQVEYEFKRLSYNDNIVSSLRAIYERRIVIDGTLDVSLDTSLQEAFWREFQQKEDSEFLRFSLSADVSALSCLMEQLVAYHVLASEKKWTSESVKAEAAMKRVIRRLLGFVLERFSTQLEKWKLREPDFWVVNDDVQWKDTTIKWNETDNSWFATPISWDSLSPLDWYNILGSLILLSGNKYYYENFGREKMVLQHWMVEAANHTGPKKVDRSQCMICYEKLNSQFQCDKCKVCYGDFCPCGLSTFSGKSKSSPDYTTQYSYTFGVSPSPSVMSPVGVDTQPATSGFTFGASSSSSTPSFAIGTASGFGSSKNPAASSTKKDGECSSCH